MSFSMSGGGWEYNRFDEFEKALSEGAKGYQEGGEVVADCEDGTCGKCSKCKKKKEGKKSSSAKPDYLDVDKDGDKEEDMKDAIEDNGGAISENRQAAYTAGESEKGGDNSAAKVTGGKTIDIKDLPKLKEPSAEEKAKARKALGLTKEETELFSADELAAIAEVLGEGLSVLDQMKVSKEYFAKRNARSDEEKAAEKKAEAQSRAKTSAMHKQPDPYKARAGESD